MRPLLSVCIPTYNRSLILKRTIENLIKLDSNDFEIVVSDNGSTDSTQEILHNIVDPRVSISRNEKNMGFVYNCINVLENSNGKYCMLLSDEDDAELGNVLKVLKSFIDVDPFVVKGNHFDYYSDSVKNSFKTFAFRFAYMSGIVFKRNEIDFLDLKAEFNKEGNGYLHVYPHIYLTNQLLLKGSVFTTRIPFYRFRDQGKDHMDKINNLHYTDLMSRFHQTKSNLDYVITNVILENGIKMSLLLSLYRGFLSYARGGISENDMVVEIKQTIVGAFPMRPLFLLKIRMSEYYSSLGLKNSLIILIYKKSRILINSVFKN